MQQAPTPGPIPEKPPVAVFQKFLAPTVPSGPQSQFLSTAGLPLQAPFIPPVPVGPHDNAQLDGVRQSRKRTFNEGFQNEQAHGDSRGHSFKTPRTRRGGGSRGDRMGGPSERDTRSRNPRFPQNSSGYPGIPPGFPGIDQSDPIAAMLALQSMGFPQIPGIPQIPIGNVQTGDQGKIDQPCQFYETTGICYLGAACPYKHGQDPTVVTSKDNGALDHSRTTHCNAYL